MACHYITFILFSRLIYWNISHDNVHAMLYPFPGGHFVSCMLHGEYMKKPNCTVGLVLYIPVVACVFERGGAWAGIARGPPIPLSM